MDGLSILCAVQMDSSGGNNMSKTYCQERESSVDRSERQTKQYDVPSARHLEILQGRTREDRQPSQLFPVKPHIIQPHPPQDQSTERTGKRKLRVPSVGKEQSKPPCNTGQSQSGTRGRSSEKSVHPLCRRVNSEEAVTPGKLQKDAGDQTADKWHSSDQSEDSIGSNSSGQALVGLQAVSPDLYLPMKGSDREDSSGDEGIEPQLKLKDIFTYSSRPHSAKHRQQSVPVEVFLSLSASRGDGDSDQRGARLEDDFLGGDSEEEFDWRNYRPTRMSASELHMLASLRRQQDEELQDESNSPGLSASQIDNCNVSISTSSDDTTTWNSCRPPTKQKRQRFVMSTAMNNIGSGLNIVLLNGQTGEIIKTEVFNMYSGDVQPLLNFLKDIKSGQLILVASFDEIATKMTDEVREFFTSFGSSLIKSVKYRDNWVFVGAAGFKEKSPFEMYIKNDKDKNIYDGWPELLEMDGCIPMKT
ncbi:FAM3C protein, partial [Amia calva]|nr:FAM3C protein [Amia calva]